MIIYYVCLKNRFDRFYIYLYLKNNVEYVKN